MCKDVMKNVRPFEGPYKLGNDSDSKWFVSGPGPNNAGGEFNYHGGYMNPHTRFYDESTCNQVVHLCNMAHKAGYEQAQRDLRKALGIT